MLPVGAEAGDPRYQLALGKAYASGDGLLKVSDDDAVFWLRRSADNGNAEAMFNLGVSASMGRGVKKDHTQAARWYNLAKCRNGQVIPSPETPPSHSQSYRRYPATLYVDHHYPDRTRPPSLVIGTGTHPCDNCRHNPVAQAALFLGNAYAYGIGVRKSLVEAVKLFRLGANQGNVAAVCNLGRALATGQGVHVDLEEALKWYSIASEGGATQRQQQQHEDGNACRSGAGHQLGTPLSLTSSLESLQSMAVMAAEPGSGSSSEPPRSPLDELDDTEAEIYLGDGDSGPLFGDKLGRQSSIILPFQFETPFVQLVHWS